MKKIYNGYIKKSVCIVAVAYGIYHLYGLAITPYHSEKIKVNSTTSSVTEYKTKQIRRPPAIDILPRIFTPEEVYARFEAHSFRAKNDFSKCRLMIKGKVESIGTSAFFQKPVVTLKIKNSFSGINFEFENKGYNNDNVASLNIDDNVIIAGYNANMGPLGGLFLEDSQIMTNMLSKTKNQLLVLNGGIYDKEICKNNAP